MHRKAFLAKRLTQTAILVSISLFSVSCGKKSPSPSPVNQEQPIQVPGSQQPEVRDDLPTAGFYNNADGSPIFALLNGAKTSLDIEIYQMADADVRAAIRNALARKIKVRVVKEPAPLGDDCNVFTPIEAKEDPTCADQKKLRAEIIEQGGHYVPFNKDNLCANPARPCFEHGKMVIADQKAVLISTGNFNSSNLCNLKQNPGKCNRDFTVIQRKSEIVSLLSKVFENDLKGEKYNLRKILMEEGAKDQVTVSPFSLDPLVDFVKSAAVSIRIQNQYLKEPNLNQALIEAARRGVHVEITVASVCSFGPPSAREAESQRALFGSFIDAGFSVRLLPSAFKINGKPGYLHSKAIVIDDRKAWVGSVNGSSSATSNNREFGTFFEEPAWVASLAGILKADHESPDTETLEESLACKKDRNSSGESGGDGDGNVR